MTAVLRNLLRVHLAGLRAKRCSAIMEAVLPMGWKRREMGRRAFADCPLPERYQSPRAMEMPSR